MHLYCREFSSNSSSCITNHAQWSDGTLCSEPRTEIKVRIHIPFPNNLLCHIMIDFNTFIDSNHRPLMVLLIDNSRQFLVHT